MHFASRRLSVVLYIIAIITVSGCNSDTPHELVLTGSSTIAPLMADLAAAYEKSNPGWRIDVQSGGSSRGIRDVRQELADAGMVSRSLTAAESDLSAHTLARDGVALIVNSHNPVKSLDKQEVRGIYRGEIENWSEPGGSNQPITVINKAAGHATLMVFLEYYELEPETIKADIIAGENQQVIRSVAGDPAAIGYVSAGSAEFEAENGMPIKLLLLEGVRPTAESIRSGEYPLKRELHIVTRGNPGDELRKFMAFWRTPEAARIIREHYFVPVAP